MKNKLPDFLIDQIPKYEKIEEMPQAFENSTHRLWRLQSSNIDGSNHFLKVCSNIESQFWQIMHDLFDFELRMEINHFSDSYKQIDDICSLNVPELIQAETLDDGNAFILTSELNGQVIDTDISHQMVRQLALHLAELHSHTNNRWGSFNKATFDQAEWFQRVETTLRKSAQKWGGASRASARQRWSVSDDDPKGEMQSSNLHSNNYLKQALESLSKCEASDFVPVMLDLRWDQFLQQNDSMTALVDLDAFVYAPRELDFVILEYLLSSDQLEIFSENYTKYQVIPVIKQVRPAYRLLLFYMQILGETDLNDWMNKAPIFN